MKFLLYFFMAMVLLACGLLFTVWRFNRPLEYYPPTSQFTIKVDKEFSQTISDRFLSYSIDLSQVIGKAWWSESGDFEYLIGGGKDQPFNFKRAKLIEFAQNLGPSYLRFGGSMADKLDYFSPSILRDLDSGAHFVLDKEQLDKMFDFAKETNSKILFNISADPRKWNRENEIILEEYRELLIYLKSKEDLLYALEFGNEIAIHGMFYGLQNLKSAESYGKNFLKLKEYATQLGLNDVLWAGPANPYWPLIGEWFKPILNSTENFVKTVKDELEILTWHYYPTQSTRCGKLRTRSATPAAMLDPKALDEVKIWAQDVKDIQKKYAPEAEIWMGETALSQCGGQKNISDSFIGTLWWIDHLSNLALTGHKVVVRQVLSGADYGLIRDRDLRPRPDYWASVIWKKLIGTKVLKLIFKEPWPWLRGYAFCGKKSGEVVYLFINISEKDSVKVENEDFVSRDYYYLTKNTVGLPSVKTLPQEMSEVSLSPNSILFLKSQAQQCL